MTNYVIRIRANGDVEKLAGLKKLVERYCERNELGEPSFDFEQAVETKDGPDPTCGPGETCR